MLNGRTFEQAMLDPTTTVSFVNGAFYNKDLNNFGPTIGFAWDVTKDGKTAVRGGYSLSFVNEESVTVGRAAARGNAGPELGGQPDAAVHDGGGRDAGHPRRPTFLSERTLANQVALGTNSILWGIDPNIKSPHVHQVSMGIQREVGWGTAIEARYVGTFGREIWRGTDYNQIKISPDFLADFNRARSNGYLAQQAGLPFSPVFNAAVPGSQQLTVLPNFGLLTNAAAVSCDSNERGGRAGGPVPSPGRRSGSDVQGRVPSELRHLRCPGRFEWRLQQLQLAAARNAPQIPWRLLRTVELHATPTPRPTRRAPRRTASKRSWTTSVPS